MQSTGAIDRGDVAAFKGFDQREMFLDGNLIPRAFIALVPLIMVVEDHGDNVLEAFDKAVWRDCRNQPVKSAVQLREILKSSVDICEQLQMCRPHSLDLFPDGRPVGQSGEQPCGAHFEHLPDLEQFERETGREPFKNPAGILTLLDQPIFLKSVEKFTDNRCRDAEFPGQFRLIDFCARKASPRSIHSMKLVSTCSEIAKVSSFG